MGPAIRRMAVPAVSLALVTGAGSCTLDLTIPVEPPPETWDPALNTHPDGASFQALLDRYAGEGLPGVVLLIHTPEGLWNGAAGYARIETGDRMAPTHRLHAASATKMYTAAAALLLAEDGLLELDAPIRSYLPQEIWEPIPNGSQATVRQLLAHTSGIPDFSGALAYELDFLNRPSGAYPPGRLLSYLHGQGSIFAPGAGYFYSNANYYLLALLMDQVAGSSHADVITGRILRPLDLHATFYRNEPGYPRPAGLVNTYEDLAGDGRIMNVTDLTIHGSEVFFGNAGLMATSADFAAFLEGLLGGRILAPSSLAAMQNWGERSRYGLGLNFIETAWGRGIGHSGGDVGVLAQVRRFPDQDATVVLLANAGDSGVPRRLFRELWDEALEMAFTPLTPRTSSPPAPAPF